MEEIRLHDHRNSKWLAPVCGNCDFSATNQYSASCFCQILHLFGILISNIPNIPY